MLLELRNLNKRFGAVVVADDINLDVAEGEALGIIGPNGAGKSSLFNLIDGNLVPDSGSVSLDAKDVTRSSARLRTLAGMGRSFQIPQPFTHMTVFENVSVAACYGNKERESDVQDRTVEILYKTGLLDKANMPASTLNLLQRKRLEMARALATQPRLLLLDEIAGGLTEAECYDLVATIQDIHAQGVTIVWIEHVVHALLAVVDRLIALDFGAIIAQGSPASVMQSDAVQKIYLGVEA